MPRLRHRSQTSIAWRLYQRGKRSRSPRFFFRWYEAPSGSKIDDPKAMRAANPSRWVTMRYLREELTRARGVGLESEFRRFHLNQWTSTKEAAIPLELWDRNKARPRIPVGSAVMLGVDAAPKRDSTGLAIVHQDAKARYHARVRIMHADPDTGYLDFAALEQLIRDACHTYDVQRIFVDAAYMIRSMQLLAEEGYPVEEFSQGDAMMVPASMTLYEVLIAERLRHGGDPELRDQVQAAAKRLTERGWRLQKRGSAGNIGGLVALAMPTYEWERGDRRKAESSPSLFV